MDLGQLIWRIEADTTNFNNKVKGTEKQAGGLGNSFQKVGNIIKTAFTVAGIVKFGKAVISAAADAQELENKYSVVFGNISGEVDAWIENYAEATARGEQDTKTFLTSLQDIRTGFGDNTASAAEFSKAVLGVTNDLSSFSNVSFEETFNAIQSGLSGQFEALRRLGVGLNVAIINQGEYAESINKTWQEMSNLEKQEAILNGILSQSANAVGQNVESWEDYNYLLGDAANTSDSFANQLQGFKGEVKDLSAEIGAKFLPIATDVISIGRGLIKTFADMSGESQELSLEIAGLAAAFITGGWIGAAIAGIAILAIEIADAINPIDELQESTEKLISSSEEYSQVLKQLSDDNNELSEAEASLLDVRRQILGADIQGALITLGTAYDQAGKRVENFSEREDDLLDRQAKLVERYNKVVERYGADSERAYSVTLSLQNVQERLARVQGNTNEALQAQQETVDDLSASYANGVLNIKDLIGVNKELFDQVLNSAAVQGDYVAQVDSLNLAYERGYITTQQYTTQLNALRDEAAQRQDQLAAEAELERELENQRAAANRQAQLAAEENAERLEKIRDLAEEYRIKLFELDAKEEELIEAERARALASVEGNEEAIEAIEAYYDRLQEKRAEDEKDQRTTLEKLKDYWDEYGGYVSQLADLVFQAWADANDKQFEKTISNLDEREQAELEAAGLAEETERERAERALQTAIESGDAVAEAEAQANLKRLDILEKYEKERVQAQYEADLQAYNLAVTQSIINGALATLKAFSDGGWVQGLIVGALAAVEIGVVAANKPQRPSFADGGIVPGTSYSGDNVQANVNSREMVLTQEQQARLFQMANGQTSMSNSGMVHNATFPIYLNDKLIAERVVNGYINKGIYPIDMRRGTK